MLAVWKNGGGHGELGLEVERWPGIVTEEAGEPLGLTEMTAEEKKVRASCHRSSTREVVNLHNKPYLP